MLLWRLQAEEIGARSSATRGSCGEVEGADGESVFVDAVTQLAWETEEGGVEVVEGGTCSFRERAVCWTVRTYMASCQVLASSIVVIEGSMVVCFRMQTL